jgi:hypothetical protein
LAERRLVTVEKNKQITPEVPAMSIELDDIASAFAELQKRTDNMKDIETRIAIDNAIDALLMGIGSLELRINEIERTNRPKLAPKEMPQVNPAFDGFPKLLKN